MLTGVNRLKTTGSHGSQVEDAIPPTSTGAVASSQGARGGGLKETQGVSGIFYLGRDRFYLSENGSPKYTA